MQEGSAKPSVEARSERIPAFCVLGMSAVFVLTATAGTQGLRSPVNLHYPDTFQKLYKQPEECRHLLECATAVSEHPANMFTHCCNEPLQD